MKIENSKITNNAIEININTWDFSQNGIYIINGKNGSGKTTLIEQALRKKLFGGLGGSYEDNISYMSQKRFLYETSVRELLKSDNENATQKYLSLFSINHLTSKQIYKLSGGELTKVLIIRTLAKNTRCLIFDEPTNYLDNESKKILQTILDELKQDHIIILVSHDPEFTFKEAIVYNIEKKENLPTTIERKNNSIQETSRNHLKFDKINLWNVLLSKYSFNVLLFSFLLMTLILNISFNYLSGLVYNYDKIPSNNMVELMDVGGYHCNAYVKSSLNIDDKDELCSGETEYLTLLQLNELFSKDYVKDIYLRDENYVNSLEPSNQLTSLMSQPNIISESTGGRYSTPCGESFLLKGSLPKDNEKEIMVSVNILQNQGYSADLGTQITVDEQEYSLSGISSLNNSCISFAENQNMGTIKLTDETMRILDDLSSEDLKLMVKNVFIVTKDNHTKEVVDYISKVSPRYQIISNYTTNFQFWLTAKRALPKLIGLVIAIVAISQGLSLLFNKKAFYQIKNKIEDNNTIYFAYNKNRRILLFNQIIISFLSTFSAAALFKIIQGFQGNLGILLTIIIAIISVLNPLVTLFGFSSLYKRLEK